MRIIIGQLEQETNTFSPAATRYEDFNPLFGDEIIAKHIRARTEVSGFIKTLHDHKAEIVPTMAAWAVTAGRVRRDDFRRLTDRFLKEISSAGKADGILLALHGALAAEGTDDGEGYILQRVRQEVGKPVPVVASLDLHSNLTEAMLKNADALVGYDTYPHVDLFETGERAAHVLISTIESRIRPVMAMRKVPMLLPAENSQSYRGPLFEIMKGVQKARGSQGIVSTSIFIMQPWLDVEDAGFSSLVVADGDATLAQKEADRLARLVWAKRKEFDFKLVSLSEAIKRAGEVEDGPVILADSADGTGSGSPGDSNAVLKGLIEAGFKGKAAIPLVDPEAVGTAFKAGVGSRVELEVGGKIDRAHHKPFKVKGYVKLISDGKFIYEGPVYKGAPADMGRAVLLVVGDIHIVLMEKAVFSQDQSVFKSVGIDPKDFKVVVVKSPNGFRASYEPIAKEIMVVEAPGVSSGNLRSVPYKNVRRPIYPLDEGLEWRIS